MRRVLAMFFVYPIFFYGFILGNSENFSKIVKKVSPSLVRVRSWVAHAEPSPHFDMVGNATGTVISSDGYILTNAHLVTYQGSLKRFDRTEVLITGHKYVEAKVIGVDPENDLALLKVNAPALWLPIKTIELEKKPRKILGQMVVKGGFPGAVISNNLTFAHGFITNERAFFEDYSTPYYVLDLRISLGDSGGPVLNSKGRIIAISTLMFISDSMSLLVPAHIVNRVLPRLYKGDKRTGWLGINPSHCLNVEDVWRDDNLKKNTEEYLKKHKANLPNLSRGIIIMVFADQVVGDAKLLRIGDTITKINGKIPQDRQELVQWIAEQEPGSKIELAIVRNGKQMTLKLNVGEYKWKTPEVATRPSGHF